MPLMNKVVKEFEVQEGTIEGGYYKIVVKDRRGNEVDCFETPTQREAYLQMTASGYKIIPGTTPVRDYDK